MGHPVLDELREGFEPFSQNPHFSQKRREMGHPSIVVQVNEAVFFELLISRDADPLFHLI